MADVTVTIPTNKVVLAKLAVEHHAGQEMTNAEIIAWLKARWISDLRAMSRNQQDAVRNAEATYEELI